MSFVQRVRRTSLARTASVSIAALVVGGLLALGMTAPAFATNPVAFTVKLTNRGGIALTGYDIYPIQVADGTATPGDDSSAMTPVAGRAGSYSAALTPGDSYTLLFIPNGASATSGTIQYLGGTTGIAGATTFTPSLTNTYIGASIATGATITGKLTGPTGAVVKYAEVDAYQFDGTNWTTSEYTKTNSAGSFTFSNAVPGLYRFEFYAPGGVYPPIYSGGSTTLAGAATSFAAVGSTVSVNQRFTVGTGSITGTALVNFDGSEYDHNGAIPVAIPVTSTTGPTIDLDKSVAGSASATNGTWAIRNLTAGQYVVQLDPGYYGESTEYLTNTVPSDNSTNGHFGGSNTLSGAYVYTVTNGTATVTGTSEFIGNDLDGADPQITVDNSGSTPVAANVEVYPTSDPLDFVSGTADSNGNVTLVDQDGNAIFDDGFGDGEDNPLEPGEYTIVAIDPSQGHEPFTTTEYLGFGSTSVPIHLANLIASPGFTSAASISGGSSTAVGSRYTASATSARSDAVTSYQWLRAGQPIFGATGATYTSTGADLNAQVSVRVTATSFGFNPVYSYASVSGVTTIGSAPVINTLPSVSPNGVVAVGTTLQASVGTWTLASQAATGLSYSYQWVSNGNPISGATASTYLVQPGDFTTSAATNITVSVTAHKTGYADSAPATSTVALQTTGHAAPAVTKAPTISHKTVGGVTTYTVTTGSWNVASLVHNYTWTLGNAVVGTDSPSIATGATTPVGVLPAAGALMVSVSGERTGYFPGSSIELLAVKGTSTFTRTAAPTFTDAPANTAVSGTDTLYYGDHITITSPGTFGALNDQHTGILPSGFAYQWYRNGVAIKGATANSYTVGTADLAVTNDTELSEVETTISSFYTGSAQAAVQVGQVHYRPLASATASLVGPHEAGQAETASVTSWGGVTGVVTGYQWYDCPATTCADATNLADYLPISKAITATLALSAAYANVAVLLTGSKVGYTTQHTWIAPVGVAPATVVTNTALPTIVGTASSIAHVGVRLTAGNGSWSVLKPAFAYLWQSSTDNGSSWQPISGATASTYTPTPTDYASGGTRIRVAVTATKSPASSQAFSSAYVIGLGTLTVIAPKLMVAASTETVTSGSYAPALGTVAYHWYVDGASQASTDTATSSVRTRDLTNDAGKAVYVDVTYTANGYTPIVNRLLAQRGATTAAAITITGGPQFGGILGISAAQPFSNAQNTSYALSYQWSVGTTKIKGATLSTYSPPAASLNQIYTVSVTGSNALYATSVVTSAAMKLTAGTFTSPSTGLQVNGAGFIPGNAITALSGTYTAFGLTSGTGFALHYQWQRSTNAGVTWASISAAIAVTYTPVATDVQTQIRAVITATKAGYTSLVLTTDPTTIQYSPSLATIVPPSFATTGKVGAALTIVPGVWNTPLLSYSYTWYRNGVVINGVTGASWTPTADSLGTAITVTVTAGRVGWQPVTVTSQESDIVAGDAPIASSAPVISKVTTGVYTVSPGAWTVDGLTYTYQWQVTPSGQPAVNASGTGSQSATFTPDGSQAGPLSVVVTVTRAGYAAGTRTVTSSLAIT